MSIKKEAYSKNWYELNERVFDALADDKEFTPRSLWDFVKENPTEGADVVSRLTGLTDKQALTWLTKGKPNREYSKDEQISALVLFKALLLYNALIEEAKMTGKKDLVQILNSLKDAIINLDRQEEAFESLGEMFFWSLKEQKQKLIRAKLRNVRGHLNSTKEITTASVVAVLFCELVTSSDIREIQFILDGGGLKSSFKDLVKAKGNLSKLASCSITGSSAIKLKNAISKALKDYSPNTGKVATSAETKNLATQLQEIKDDKSLTESLKIIQQQKVIDESDLDEGLKKVVRILSDADVIIRGGELKTEVAVELGLTKDQEDAMLGSDTRMTLISAGAGSGKTRVLSGKVANLVSDDVTPYNIMAVSFSRKSAQDLAEKVKEAVGSKIPQMSHTAIGRTTHSIAQEIVNRFHPQAGSSTIVANKFELDRLIKRAIKLVKETEQGSSEVKAKSLFADKIDFIAQNQKRNDLSVLNLLIAVEKYRKDMGFLKDFEKGIVERLIEIRRKLLDDESLTAEEIGLVNQELKTDRGGKVLNKAFAGDSSKYTFNKQKKTASASDNPQWWGSRVEGKEEPKINPKEAQLFITKCKANMVSPTEAYNRVNKPDMDESFILKAKVYGAYSHILTEEGLSDFDDMLIEAVKVLSRKKNLNQLQKQYKHIIVDEAQDLNPVQHAFFGLLSGTMKAGGRNGDQPPVPVENPVMEEGRSITFIGDENQSIYGFRGAQSSEFSSKARQNQGAFETMTLGVNFRSTKAIVDAANKLISEEDDSLGMICTAVFQEQDNGSDSIKRDTEHQSPYDAAGAFAETVNLGTSREETYKYSDYGVACRTNAELIPYALSLLDKDIDFTCPVNPFKHPTTKKILRALSLASSMIGGGDGIGQFFGAFLNVHKDLKFGLSDEVNEVFKKHLKNPKTLNELQTEFDLLEGEDKEYFFLKKLDESVKVRIMAGAILEIFKNEGGLFTDHDIEESNYYCNLISNVGNVNIKDPADLFDIVIGTKPIKGNNYLAGPKGETIKSMIEGMSKTHPEQMAEALNSIESEEQIQELKTVDFAMAPLVALRNIFLKGVAKGKRVDEILGDFDYLDSKTGEAAKKSREQGLNAVTLDTIHGWKGLEVTHLTVPMVEGKFPSDKEDYDPIVHENEEQAKRLKAEQERMLAYVAVTRGKKSVTVQSYAQTGGGKDAGESEFISKIFGEDNCKTSALNTARQILAETIEVSNDNLSDREIDLAIKMFG